MEKTIQDFIFDNFESWDGLSDDFGDTIDIWNYDGDKLILSLVNEDDVYIIRTWHENNKSAKSEEVFLGPNENELKRAVEKILFSYIGSSKILKS